MSKLALVNSNGDHVKTDTELRFRPLGDNLLVRQIDSDKRGSIYLPKNVEQSVIEAEVLRVGPGNLRYQASSGQDRIPVEVKPGDRVIFSRMAAVGVDPQDAALLIVPEGMLMLVEERK